MEDIELRISNVEVFDNAGKKKILSVVMMMNYEG